MILEIVENKMLYNRSGKQSMCTKISLAFSKTHKMGFNQKNKEALIGYGEDYIIIKKKPKNLLRFISVGKLENGVLLLERDYDTVKGIYTNGVNEETLTSTNKQYKPFYLGEKMIGCEEIEDDN